MNLSDLTKITKKRQKRLGQGHGSGRSKTAGRGTKGQKARHSIPLDFEGGALPLIKRMPFLRGKGKNYSLQNSPEIINLKQLQVFAKDTVIDEKAVIEKGLVTAKNVKKFGIKILGDGEFSTPLIIKIPISQQAKAKVEKAGGRVE